MVTFFIAIQSCKKADCNWSGGAIVDYGNYCGSDFNLKVYEENNYLKYELMDSEKRVVVKQDMNISVAQRWGLFLDSNGNFWVFSSDVGDAVWKKDSLTGEYKKKMFRHWLTKDSVPDEVYFSSVLVK